MMRVFPISPPKRINPDALIETLGHPLSVESRTDGLAIRVTVQDQYERLDGTIVVPTTTDDQVRAAISAHDPTVESAAEKAQRDDLAERTAIKGVVQRILDHTKDQTTWLALPAPDRLETTRVGLRALALLIRRAVR